MTFTPVSRLCINCKERLFITGSVDGDTCPICGEVMKVFMAKMLRLSKIPDSSAEKASNLPLVGKTENNSRIG
ncbi:hypothetical protein [uncultured Methanolobus sp.]|uniref:hypothetical protein n=1 Tax=uncultured Methanolobus sp. TaxID=218300 RepID=UPI0029C90475|nr:hypothetical protein [uncultured Methanolobus sp.]